MAQLLAKVEVLRTLPPQAFWPAPKIESALVRLTRDDRLGASAGPFGTFVHQLFSARRKTLRRALARAGIAPAAADAAIARLGLDPQARPETLTPQTLHRLFTSLGTVPA